MPSLYHDARRKYYIIYKLYLPNGQIKKKTKYYKAKIEAKRALGEITIIEQAAKRREITKDKLLYALNHKYINEQEYKSFVSDSGAGGVTLNNYVNAYEQYSQANCMPYTSQENLKRLRRILSYFGNVDIAEITETKIEEFKNYRINSGRAPNTINQDLHVLRRLLDFPVGQGIIKENVARKVKLIPNKQSKYPKAIKRH
ncbi:MAG: phage integrase N-terminal SAM-like domain-containing protein [Thermodesulfobacteriota bacterium]|nr:phage integrase N-terminal SAM-like domain-containing protein [Thermodesulfobacteriota bacterium]